MIGSHSGGNPTAEQWEVLFRVLLPFMLIQLWSTSLGGDDNEELTFAPVKPAAPRPLSLNTALWMSSATAAMSFTTANTTSACCLPSQPQPGVSPTQTLTGVELNNAEVNMDIAVNIEDEEDEANDTFGGELAGQRHLPGLKQVWDVFQSAMLLCSIMELVSGDLDSAQVDKLADCITKYNHSQAKLLGSAWLTFNNHNVSHLPHFIRHFGSPRNFSSLLFEQFNGIMGTIPTKGHKGGVLEATIMCNMAQ